MQKVNRNDAPPGTRAYAASGKHTYSCKDCHFVGGGRCPRDGDGPRVCFPNQRRDSRSVVFMTREEHARAKSKA